MHQCILTNSKNKHLSTKLGAIAAIRTLVTCPATSPELQATKLHRIVSDVLATNKEHFLLEEAAEALGEA
jgi:hypothetical protein